MKSSAKQQVFDSLEPQRNYRRYFAATPAADWFI